NFVTHRADACLGEAPWRVQQVRRRPMKFHTRWFAVAALGAAATFNLSAQTVKIGAVQGLSGPPAIVDFGESYLQGNQLALKEYNANSPKHKIEFIVYNDEANPQRAVSLVQRLISNDRVSIVVGT